MKRIITTALMLTVIVACSFAQSIVGAWKTTPETFAKTELPEGSVGSIIFNFKQNKTCNVNVDITIEQETPQFTLRMAIKASIPGTYNAANNVLSGKFDAQKMTLDIDMSFPGMDAATQAQVKKIMDAQLPTLKKQMRDQLSVSLGDLDNGTYRIEGDYLYIDEAVLQRVK